MPMKGQSHRPLMPVQGHFAAGFLEQWYAGYQMQSKLSVFLPLLQQNTTMESIKAMAHGLLLFPPNPFSLKSGKAGCLKSQLECHYCCLQKSLNSIKNNQSRLTTSQGSTLKRRKREGKKKRYWKWLFSFKSQSPPGPHICFHKRERCRAYRV